MFGKYPKCKVALPLICRVVAPGVSTGRGLTTMHTPCYHCRLCTL